MSDIYQNIDIYYSLLFGDDLKLIVLCSLKETCNILDEQEKVMKSNIEQLNQKSHLIEYVKSVSH